MSDSKISDLPAATTPLSGDEQVPIVQSGVNRRATVNDLTAAAVDAAIEGAEDALDAVNAAGAAQVAAVESAGATQIALAAAEADRAEAAADTVSGSLAILRLLQNLLGTTALGPLEAPSFDQFTTPSTNIIGRSLAGRGGTWSLERGTDVSSTHDTSMSVANGFAGGNGVAGAGNTLAVASTAAATHIVARRINTQFGSNLDQDHVTASGGTNANSTRFGVSSSSVAGPPLSGRINLNAKVAGGSLTSFYQINNLRREPLDVQAHEYTASAGVTTLQFRLNGRARDPAQDVSPSVRSVPLTGKHGFVGSNAANHLDWFAIVDPANDAVVMTEQQGRIISVLPDGRGLVALQGRYTRQRPGRIYARLNDRSGPSVVPVAGYANVQVALAETPLNGLYGTFKGSFFVDAATMAGLIGKPLELWVWRDDVVDASGALTTVEWPSPVQRPGLNVLGIGQSLSTQVFEQYPSGTVTAPAGSVWLVANSDIAQDARYTIPLANDRLPAHMVARIHTLTGLVVCAARGGKPSTSTSERLPGTPVHDADLDAIAHMGGRVDYIVDVSGQNDVSRPSEYYAEQVQIFASLAAASLGPAPKVIVAPLNKTWSATPGDDAVYHELRKQQARLVEQGAAQILAPNVLDLRNHDTLHLSNGGAGSDPVGSGRKFAARIGQVIAYLHGAASHDGQGPELVAVERTNSTTITAWFDDGGWFDSFAIVGTSGAGYHGGCRFSASTDASNPIWPNGCTVGARETSGPHTGRWRVTFSFASTLPGTVYVWAGYGRNPHNPLQDSTINSTTWDDPSTGASILQATKTGAPEGLDKVGIRPRLRFATPSYLVAA